MGCRGSLIPFFLEKARNVESLPITVARMTRFMITLSDAVSLVLESFDDLVGGETYVRKIPSMGILDVEKAVAPETDTHVVGIRPGEKLHEQMIGAEESSYTYEFDRFFKILPTVNTWDRSADLAVGGTRVAPGFTYASDTNPVWMSVDELRDWISGEMLEN
jgi:FlaA1/EpsC-like NDP-sugar epimerase